MVCLGLLAMLGGLGWIYLPLAPIVGGFIMLLIGVAWHREVAMLRRIEAQKPPPGRRLGDSA